MQVNFRTAEGTIHKLILEPRYSVNDIISKIIDYGFVPTRDFSLSYKGKKLERSQVLSDLNICENDEVLIQYSIIQDDPLLLDINSNDLSLIGGNASVSEKNQLPKNEDPSNFNELVVNLTELGYPISQCKEALRMSNYQPDAAASLLMSGTLTETKPHVVILDAQDFEEEDLSDDSESEDFVNQASPKESPVKVKDSFNQFRTMMNEFSVDQRAAVSRLQRMYPLDESVILQVFVACDKNEMKAAECLSTLV